MQPNRLGSQKASTCSRNKFQCLYQWLLIQPPLSATFRESGLIICSFSPSLVRFRELPLDQAYCLSEWTNPSGPDFLSHLLPPSALQLDLGSSVQFSDVSLCLYLHPSLDEGSMVLFEIFISVTMGTHRYPLLYCPRTPWIPSRAKFHATLKWLP